MKTEKIHEEREARMIVNRNGGKTGGTGNTFRATLPAKWIRSMGLDEEERELLLSFDGERITITKK